MQIRPRTLSIILAGALVPVILCAQPPAETDSTRDAPTHPRELYLLDETSRPPEKGSLVIANAVERFAIELDPAGVAADPQLVELELPGGVRLEAHRRRFVVYNPTWISWSGDLRHAGLSAGAGTGYIHLVYHGEQVTGILNFEKERYQITGSPDGGHRLVRLAGHRVPLCGLPSARSQAAGVGSPLVRQASPGTPAFPSKSAVQLDVLALYSRDTFTSPVEESAVRQFIQASVSLANDAFVNSGVNAYYELVHAGPIPIGGPEPPMTGDIFHTLNWLDTQLGSSTTYIAMQREEFSADLVTLFVPFNSEDACGVAMLPEFNPSMTEIVNRGFPGAVSSPFNDRAYTVNRVGCGLNDFTLAHEFGHNYGMRHHDDIDLPVHLFGFGRGHLFQVNNQERASIMGCTDGTNFVCGRVPHFSDPNITYANVPTGEYPSGSDAGRNNAEVARIQVPSYSSFRVPDLLPVPVLTVECNIVRKCTFDGSASSDDFGIVSYRWNFGDGSPEIETTDPVIVHRYPQEGDYTAVLTVTDTGQQTASAQQTVQVIDRTAALFAILY